MGCYLIGTGGGLVLIDTAISESIYLLADPIHRLGYKPENTREILLNRAHSDHCGAAGATKELTGASVYLSSEDCEFYRKCPKETLVLDPDPHPQDFTVDAFYSDGRPVTLGDIPIWTMLTPGHTIGRTNSFWEKKNPANGGTYVVVTHRGVGANTMNDDYYASNTHLTPDLGTKFLRDAEKLRGVRVGTALSSHPNRTKIVDRAGQYTHEAQPYSDDTVWAEFVKERTYQVRELMK